jgi:hypothetical protein
MQVGEEFYLKERPVVSICKDCGRSIRYPTNWYESYWRHRYPICKQCAIARAKANYRANIEKMKAYNKKYRATHRALYRAGGPYNYEQIARQKIIRLLGSKCSNVHCGFSDPRALQIDHVNGGGVKQIREYQHHGNYYHTVLKLIESGSHDYQLLCANCNWIKRAERGEQPNRVPACN